MTPPCGSLGELQRLTLWNIPIVGRTKDLTIIIITLASTWTLTTISCNNKVASLIIVIPFIVSLQEWSFVREQSLRFVNYYRWVLQLQFRCIKTPLPKGNSYNIKHWYKGMPTRITLQLKYRPNFMKIISHKPSTKIEGYQDHAYCSRRNSSHHR